MSKHQNQPRNPDHAGVVNIDEILRRNPDAGVESKDNAKCKLLFERLGIIHYFRRCDSPNLSAIIHREHPTHWILGLLWSGYPKPEQNGYQVFCLPKQCASEQAVHDLEKRVMDAYGGRDYEAGVVPVPGNWKPKN
jgi:hypothetical protein